MKRLAIVMAIMLLAGGCAIPRWVPFLGKSAAKAPPAAAIPIERPESRPRASAPAPEDEHLADRVVAIVNNDAVTLGELQEMIALFRQENRQRPGLPADDELLKEFLPKFIDNRLQLQEADRERVVVDEVELDEDMAGLMKKMNMDREQFEAALRSQGLTLDNVRKRRRETLQVAKVVRKKVALRVSVTEPEIDAYLAANRDKLETGLAYHARHILVVPEAGPASDAAWEAVRVKAELLREELTAGADFAELAKKHSRDASAPDGGDLGTLKRGELAADIEARILALVPGEVSRPHRSELGYHLFRLESKETLDGEGLARVRAQIRDILYRQKYDARHDAWLKEIRQRAIIEVRL